MTNNRPIAPLRALRMASMILWMTIKNSAYHPQRVFLDFVALLSRCGILLILYKCVYDWKGSQINHTPFPVIAWSIFFFFSTSLLRLRFVSDHIARDVKSGNIENLLCKPINYLSYCFYSVFGEGAYSFILIFPVAAASIAFFIGVPETLRTPLAATSLVLTMFLGITLTFVLSAAVGLLAFWMEDIKPVYWVTDKLTMLLGGSYLPVAFFPPWMYQLSVWSPFGATQFATHIPYDSWKHDAYFLWSVQLMWILIVGTLLLWLFHKAKQQVSINGG